jgi:hypothetical protein
MNKLLLGKMLLALVFVLPAPAMAEVNVDINISLPPPIVFAAPPELVVLPETYVYVVPDADVDIFFYGGWWWRPWEGRWYRSRYYDSGWGYYRSVPSFYVQIPSGWRNDYREHRWRGQQWNYQRVPHQQVQQNWKGWEKNKHWEKQNTWGVQGLKPNTRSQQPSKAVQTKSETFKPQVREVQPRQPRPQPQAKPEVREKVKLQQPLQQPHEVQSQQPRPQSQTFKPQNREKAQPQQSESREGRPERGKEEKQERQQHER